MISFSRAVVIGLQEALSMYKKAALKMPRQFAPQSLYNMMG